MEKSTCTCITKSKSKWFIRACFRLFSSLKRKIFSVSKLALRVSRSSVLSSECRTHVFNSDFSFTFWIKGWKERSYFMEFCSVKSFRHRYITEISIFSIYLRFNCFNEFYLRFVWNFIEHGRIFSKHIFWLENFDVGFWNVENGFENCNEINFVF